MKPRELFLIYSGEGTFQDEKHEPLIRKVDRILKNAGEEPTNKEYQFVIKEVDKLIEKFDEKLENNIFNKSSR